ncbi:unnamed protein product [Candidula unifasciata]|uniref:Uncharacterized protein n=1 Tax=Candidula unifasciata TaxID=100452 RepID=A0A8S4A2Q8_9EUPU|nr:unnamed protein product [Candidula unifasciata]
MQITVATLSDQLFTIQVSEDLELENMKVLCEMETRIPAQEMAVVWNGRPLLIDKMTLKQYGIRDGEVVLVQHLQAQNSSSGEYTSVFITCQSKNIEISGLGQTLQQDDAVFIRDMFMRDPHQLAMLQQMNPSLADAMLSGDLDKFRRVLQEQRQIRLQQDQDKMALMHADPFDPNAQHLIEEAIRLRNVDSNMATAIEFAPESFGQVHMLYIDCKVNGYPVKAFVDSGAQMTIMSQSCAERCHIMRLVDRRWTGLAQGVGTQTIIGRVHLCQIQIGTAFLQSSFCILESQPMDMLLGLDMLKRHQCVIDLKKNLLQIGTSGTVTPFLAETDLPDTARLDQSAREEQELADVLSRSAQATKSKNTGKPSTSRVASTPSSQGQYSEEVVARLMSNGFSRHVVVEELRRCKGNADQALASLLSKSFGLP